MRILGHRRRRISAPAAGKILWYRGIQAGAVRGGEFARYTRSIGLGGMWDAHDSGYTCGVGEVDENYSEGIVVIVRRIGGIGGGRRWCEDDDIVESRIN